MTDLNPICNVCAGTVRRKSGRILVQGPLDLASAAILIDTVVRALPASDGGELIVDLSSVTFADCAGIGSLIYLRGQAQRRQRKLTFASPSSVLRNLAALVGLDHLFEPGSSSALHTLN